ncbi:MAG: carbon storage regulator CsrA [bacterium]
MLSLSRKVGESIMINNNIEVQVTSISKNNVVLGIVAPKKIPVHRKEIYEAIVKANKNSVSSTTVEIDIEDLRRIFKER